MLVTLHSRLQALYWIFRSTNSSDTFLHLYNCECFTIHCLCSCWILTLLLISFHFAYFLMIFIQLKFKIFSCFLNNHVSFLVATSLQTSLSVPDLFVRKPYWRTDISKDGSIDNGQIYLATVHLQVFI